MDDNNPTDSEIDILRDILSEVKDLNVQLARVDERSRMNSDAVDNMRQNRIEPLESKADKNGVRGRRNSLILGAGLTALTILVGATLTFGYDMMLL